MTATRSAGPSTAGCLRPPTGTRTSRSSKATRGTRNRSLDHVYLVDVQRGPVSLGHEIRAQAAVTRLEPDGVLRHVQATSGPEQHRNLVDRPSVGEIDEIDPAETEWLCVGRATHFSDARAEHSSAPRVFA